MEISRLRLLREFADRGSISAVADATGITPSAVSQQFKVLAAEAGVAVLEQDGRSVRLTDAGQALVVAGDAVLAAVDRAHDEMGRYRKGESGSVRASFFPSGAAMLLPGTVTVLARRGIDLIASDIDVGYPEAPHHLVDHDVVVTHRDERASAVNTPRVRAVPLMREPIDLVVPMTHPLAQQNSVALAALADEDWISVRGGFPVDDVLLSLATVTGMAPRVVHRINDFRAIESMVREGIGVALLPRHSVLDPEVHRLRITEVRAARIIEALVRPGTEKRGVVRDLLTALADQAAQLSD